MAKKGSPTCPTCGTQLIEKYILPECHLYKVQRREKNITDQLYEILGLQTEATGKLVEFLKEADLYRLIEY